MNAKKHSTLKIEIQYEKNVRGFHDYAVLPTEGLVLKNRYWDVEAFGAVVNRKWVSPVTPDTFTVEHLRIKAKDHGEAQLEAMSSEGLEILRNALGNLHKAATRILNERGGERFGLALGPGPSQEPRSLPDWAEEGE